MPLFWLLVALLVVITLAALLWPLLRKEHRVRAPDAAAAAIAVHRDQKRALDAECASGAITSVERDAALAELARRVADEVDTVPAAPAPPPQRAWWVAITLLLLIPSLAIVLYSRLGNPGASSLATSESAAHDVSDKQIAAMVDRLAQRLKQHPEDADGWVLLAHSYQALERFPEAADAYAHADALIQSDASLLADYADALAMAQERRLAGKPLQLIARALALDPKHRKALALAATAAMETRDLDSSIGYWRRLAAELPKGSDEARQVGDVIAEVEAAKRDGKASPSRPGRASGTDEAAPQRIASAAGGSAAAGAISGRVDVSAALAPKVALSDTVFIFARATEGSRMPLAALRVPARELPKDFSLDDSMGMAPGMKLSAAAAVIVEARISKGGNAMAQPGDLFGRSAPVKPGTTGLIISIDRVVP